MGIHSEPEAVMIKASYSGSMWQVEYCTSKSDVKDSCTRKSGLRSTVF